MTNVEYKGFAELFRLLSEFYKFPNYEFYEYISKEDIQNELKELVTFTNLNYDIHILKPFASFEEMKDEYTRTFIGINSTPVLPVESVYKVWTSDKSSSMSFANSKGYIMGDSALHIQYILDQYGLEIPEELGKKPDHISVLLELLGFFIDNLGKLETLEFVEDHLDWLPEFKNQLEEAKAHQFYLYTTELVIELIDDFEKMLKTEVKA